MRSSRTSTPAPSTARRSERPSKAALAAARTRRLRDVLAPGLDVLFCGINPGLYSAATGHHFARPGNRFWPALATAGFTPRLYAASEDRDLVALGLGITNLVARTTATADELAPAELHAGAAALRRKLARYAPRFLAVVGFTAYRVAFRDPHATGGLQRDRIHTTRVWLLPNPSGLNAHHQPADLAARFSELREAVLADRQPG